MSSRIALVDATGPTVSSRVALEDATGPAVSNCIALEDAVRKILEGFLKESRAVSSSSVVAAANPSFLFLFSAIRSCC